MMWKHLIYLLFVLDVTSIDNSFNLTINGTPLISRTVSGGTITNELEFQTNGTLGQNVRFVSDQATHGTNDIQQIWQFDNINNTVVNEETPIIRVIVDENLNVTIYGSRTPNGPLEEMELFNGATFNNFTWNALSPNTFVLDQAEVGATYIIGRVYGTFTDCDTDGDGINNNLDLDSDGDGCLDVVESGGIDANNDRKLDGTGISSNGQVTGGSGGYNGTNGNELFAHQMSVTTPPASQSIANGQSATFSVVATAEEATSYSNGNPIYGSTGNATNGIQYQWYIGDPENGGSPINNGGIYSGADSETLSISDVTGLDGTQYYVKLTHNKKVCLLEIENATLSVNLPTAVIDTTSTNEDTPKNIDFLDNDSFGDDGARTNTPIILANGTTTQGGTVTLNDGGTPNNPLDDTFDYIPSPNFNGVDSFQYTLTDTNGDTSTASVTINVVSQNDAPVAVNDTASTSEDTPVSFDIVGNDNDLDGTIDPATVDLDPATPGVQTTFTVPNQGTYTVDNLGEVTFTPVANFNGTTTPVNYTVNDNEGTTSSPATITVTVTDVNDAPVAVNDTASTPEDTPVSFDVVGNDTDLDGTIDPATVDLDPATLGVQTTFTVPNQGTYTVDNLGEVTFTPVAKFNGIATPVNYTVNDNEGTTSSPATITVTVSDVNEAPVAVNDSASTSEDTPVSFDIVANDTDLDGTIDPATVDLDPATPGVQTTFTVPNQGTYTVDNLGEVTFTPVANFNGSATPVNYTVDDNEGTTSSPATITVTIDPIVDAVNDVVSVDEDTPLVVDVFVNDNDVPTAGTITITQPTNGVVVITDPNGTPNNPSDDVVTYTPNPGYSGSDIFTYTICDSNSECDTANVEVTIIPISSSIGNLIWYDLNQNGIRDPGEYRLEGVYCYFRSCYSWKCE